MNGTACELWSSRLVNMSIDQYFGSKCKSSSGIGNSRGKRKVNGLNGF